MENLLSAIIGGILVIAGQYIIELIRKNNKKSILLRETVSLLTEKKMYLRNLFRELAMYKTHANYWLYCTDVDLFNDPSKSDEHRQEHLRSQVEAREVEKKIGETIAIFVGLVTKFEIAFGKKLNLKDQMSKIESITFEKALPYDSSLEYDKVKNNLVPMNEKVLREKYFEKITPFEEIIDHLKLKT